MKGVRLSLQSRFRSTCYREEEPRSGITESLNISQFLKEKQRCLHNVLLRVFIIFHVSAHVCFTKLPVPVGLWSPSGKWGNWVSRTQDAVNGKGNTGTQEPVPGPEFIPPGSGYKFQWIYTGRRCYMVIEGWQATGRKGGISVLGLHRMHRSPPHRWPEGKGGHSQERMEETTAQRNTSVLFVLEMASSPA